MNDNLLAGNPVKVDFFYVYPWKLRDIVNPDLQYYTNLFIFFMQKEDLKIPEEVAKSYNVFKLIRGRAVVGEAFRQQILQALKLFTHEDFIFHNNQFMLNGKILTSQHWEQIKTILAEENYIDLALIDEVQEEDYNYANQQAREFKKRIEETRRLVNKYKKKDELSLGFLINRLCVKSPNINILNVWDLTFYQFKQQLSATMVLEAYDLNMAAVANGMLDPKKQKIVHWTENK
jgi:hypothetical protein